MIPISHALEIYGQSKQIFSVVAPYKSRFTLPVVTIKHTTPDGSVKEKYLALPTLGLDLSGGTGHGIQCQWGYMTVDVKALELLGWLKRTGNRSINSKMFF
jgi:hypothetical protein